jgi:serine/threonine protein kinase
MHSGVISHYRIIRKLGQGGMGEVYLADDSVLGRKVAVKVLPEDSVGDDQARRRLLREARAAATLDHPNICSIHEIGDEDGTSFIVMQYVEGQTLSDRLREKPMSLKESLDIASQIASALEEAHSRGIVHRDIKPQNIIITPRGLVKVLDFGLAKILPVETDASAEQTQSLLTDAGMVIGTAPYMSPEQAKCGPVDARSDLFSLGAVLYECVTGTPAFSGSTPMEICARVIHEDPPAPSKLNPSVPPELDRIVMRLLAKTRDGRYQSATLFLTDLRDAVETIDTGRPQTRGLTKSESGLSRVSAIVHASAMEARRPRIYIPTLIMVLAIPAFFLLRRSHPWFSAAHKPSADAQRWYQAGTEHLRNGTYYQASVALQRATSADNRFALAFAREADAWTELDETDKAKDALLRMAILVPDRSFLSKLDRLYLDAITNTVTENYHAAVDAFREILASAPESERAPALVDLGRAYEKNEETEKARDSYQQASTSNGHYPAALLRLGILLGRQQHLPEAEATLKEAQGQYWDLGNFEGVTEALYQQGLLQHSVGKLSDARNFLEQALKIAETTNDEPQKIRVMLELSGVSVADGKTVEARETATTATNLAKSRGEENLATSGLIELGRAYFLRREYQDCENTLTHALEIAQLYKGRRNEARALLSLGKLYVQMENKLDQGLSYIDQSLDFFQRGGYSKEVSEILLLRGRVKLEKADYAGALADLERLLPTAQNVGDRAQTGSLHNLVGNALAGEERYPEALQQYDEAFRISEELGNRLNAGYGLIDRGDTLWRIGRYSEAVDALSQVVAQSRNLDSDYKQLLVARYHRIKAQLALSQRHLSEARQESEAALALAGSKYKRTTLEATYTLGLADVFSGQATKGRQECERAVAMARLQQDPRMLSNSLLALGEATLESGDAVTASSVLKQALESFRTYGQNESAWRASLLAGEADKILRDSASANASFSNASEFLRSLKTQWGAESFGAYESRTDIQQYTSRLGQESQSAVR